MSHRHIFENLVAVAHRVKDGWVIVQIDDVAVNSQSAGQAGMAVILSLHHQNIMLHLNGLKNGKRTNKHWLVVWQTLVIRQLVNTHQGLSIAKCLKNMFLVSNDRNFYFFVFVHCNSISRFGYFAKEFPRRNGKRDYLSILRCGVKK